MLQHLKEIPMDKVHQLEQSTGHFQSVRNGLPELVKNAKDQYGRLRVTNPADRQIVVIASSERRNLGVLDFAGAPQEAFEKWAVWAARPTDDDTVSADIEAGHGNGGKSFMVRGSASYSFFESCADHKRTRMGFDNRDPAVKFLPGYEAENGHLVRALPEPDARGTLEDRLSFLMTSFSGLPDAARAAFERRDAFSLVYLETVADWSRKRSDTLHRLLAGLPAALSRHGQASLTLDSCSVWLVVDGAVVIEGPLAVEELPALPGFEIPLRIPVPQSLPDPGTGEAIKTGSGSSKDKYLELRVCNRQLQMSDETKPLNVIRVRNNRNVVANWSAQQLAPVAEAARIHGELRVPSLVGNHLADAGWTGLADTDLVRALHAWTRDRASDLIEEIRKNEISRTSRKEMRAANEMLERLRDLMRRFLDESGGRVGSGAGDGTVTKEEGTRVDRIEVEKNRDRITVALGTTVPLFARCYQDAEKEGAKDPVVQGVPLQFKASASGFLEIDEHCQMTARQEGRVTVWAQHADSGKESNRVTVQIIRCTGVEIREPLSQLKQGVSYVLPVSFKTRGRSRTGLLLDANVDSPSVGRIDRNGAFRAGYTAGVVKVRVRYGPGMHEYGIAHVEVGDEVHIPTKRAPEPKGAGIPLMLMCGDIAPGREEYPASLRTETPSATKATVIELPSWDKDGIIWINPESREAVKARGRRGATGRVSLASETFFNFLGLKCFDILKRLRVSQQLKGRPATYIQFRGMLTAAEEECADFVEGAFAAAKDLAGKV